MKKLLLFALLIFPLIVTSQIELKIKDTIVSEISADKIHSYKIHLEENQLALVNINQTGIDLAITTFDNKGEKLSEFDSPNGRFGPELVTLKSTKKGFYTLKIKSIDLEDQVGNYKLYIRNLVDKATTLFEEVDQIFLPWDTTETPGAAVAIIKNGKVIYQKTYGIANLEYNIPLTSNTRFIPGSVAKQFTAFSILLLEKEGKLSLEDDVRKYIPEVPDFGETITLKHLANHTSGLREEAVLAALMGWDEGDIVTTEQILKVISKQKALNFKPGEKYMYCNTGYTLLAEVVSRVSGQSFAQFTMENIFKPLKMKGTQFIDNHKTLFKNKAYSYYPSGYGYLKSILNDANPGSSGLLTSIEDLTVWVQNYENSTIIDSSLFSKMQTVGVLNDGTFTNYGMGLETSNYKGLKKVHHGGAIAGYRAQVATFPKQDFAVIVLANTTAIHPLNIPNQIIDIFLKDEFISEEKNEKVVEPQDITNNEEQLEFDKTDLESYTGSYYSQELSTQYDLSIVNDKLELNHSRLKVSMIPSVKDELIFQGWGNAKIKFNRDQNGEILGFKFSMINTKNIDFKKIK